jgi:prepilin-type processing-associated H-X9-DG protein
VGAKQGAGWGYQILPYIEGQNVWLGGAAATDNARQRVAVGTLLSVFFCPSRRAPMTYTYVDQYISQSASDPVTHALLDYASNNLNNDTGAIRANRLGPPLAMSDMRDGTSTTLVVGEKRMNVYYLGKLRSDDNEGYTGGCDWDAMRNANLVPAPDTNAPTSENGFAMFGSSHPSGMNFVFGDGAVHHIRYDIDATVFARLGTRADGNSVDASAF